MIFYAEIPYNCKQLDSSSKLQRHSCCLQIKTKVTIARTFVDPCVYQVKDLVLDAKRKKLLQIQRRSVCAINQTVHPSQKESLGCEQPDEHSM